MNKSVIFWIIIVLLILVGIFGKNIFNQNSKPISLNQPLASIAPGTITVKGFNYGFSPKTIKVKQGDTVKIRLISNDSPHTFTINELGVNQEFTWGKDIDISFVASKKGTFQYYCSAPGHKENGMAGTLIVE